MCQELLSQLLKTSNKTLRAVFPYGMFDEEGLREFLTLHEAKKTEYEVQRETEWFTSIEQIVNRPIKGLNGHQLHLKEISTSDICALKTTLWYQKTSDVIMGHLSVQQLSTLVCDRWVTEDVTQHTLHCLIENVKTTTRYTVQYGPHFRGQLREYSCL